MILSTNNSDFLGTRVFEYKSVNPHQKSRFDTQRTPVIDIELIGHRVLGCFPNSVSLNKVFII